VFKPDAIAAFCRPAESRRFLLFRHDRTSTAKKRRYTI